jgi:hypothetical protein
MSLISRYIILGATLGGAIADRLNHVDILYQTGIPLVHVYSISQKVLSMTYKQW